jgi:hypothetical protein
MLELVSVTPLPDYKLHVKYSDGVEGDVDLAHLVGNGVFALWNDAASFDMVTIGQHGEVRWNDDIDLCADAIYMQVSGKSPEEVFPKLKVPADA